MKVIIIALLAALSSSKIKPEGKTIADIIYKQSKSVEENNAAKEVKKIETERKNKSQRAQNAKQKQQDNK